MEPQYGALRIAVKNRTMRFFMGVGKYTPNLAFYGDMGWIPSNVRQWVSVFRLWSRFSKMSDNRINKRIFKWAYNFSSNRLKNWCFRVMSKFKNINMDQYCDYNIVLSKSVIKDIECCLIDIYKVDWIDKLVCNEFTKLRTYKLFKTDFTVENYIKINMPTHYRSSFAKFRCGVAPIKIETGRYENLAVDSRVCFNCLNVVEDEKHVILNCPLYANLRLELYRYASVIFENFNSLSDDEKFIFLFSNSEMCYYTAKICFEILKSRKCILYSK